MWAHIPAIAKLLFPLHISLEHEGGGSVFPTVLKTIARIKTSHVNSAPYTLAHATALGRAAGMTRTQTFEPPAAP